MREQKRAYAVVRHDRFQDASTPIEIQIKVVRVFVNESEAEAEVTRLNQLNGEKDVVYFMEVTKLVE